MADQAQSQGLPKQVESVLRSTDVPDEVKAKAWDAFFKSNDENSFKTSFGAMKELPEPVKAQLWDLKSHKTSVPQRPSAMGPTSATQPTKLTPTKPTPAPTPATAQPQAAAAPPENRPGWASQFNKAPVSTPLLGLAEPLTKGIGEAGRYVSQKLGGVPAPGQPTSLTQAAAGGVETAAGVAQGLAEAGIDMSSIGNIALMAGTFGLGKTAKQLPKLAKIINILKTGLSAGFSIQQFAQLSAEIPQAAKAAEKGDWVEYGRHVAKAITDLGFGVGAARETGKGVVGAVNKTGAAEISKRDVTPATGKLPEAEAKTTAQPAGQVSPTAAAPTTPPQTQKFGVPRETKAKKAKASNVGIPAEKTSGNAKTKVPTERTVEAPAAAKAVEPPGADFEKELAEALEKVKAAKSPAEAQKPAGKSAKTTKGKSATTEAQPAKASTPPATPPPTAEPLSAEAKAFIAKMDNPEVTPIGVERAWKKLTPEQQAEVERHETGFEPKLGLGERIGRKAARATGKKAEAVEPPPTRKQAAATPTKAKPEAAPAPQAAPKVAGGVSTPEATHATLGKVIQTARAQALKKVVIHGLDSGGNVRWTQSVNPMQATPASIQGMVKALAGQNVVKFDVDPGRSDMKAWSTAITEPEAVPGGKKLPHRKPPKEAVSTEPAEPPESRAETIQLNESYQLGKNLPQAFKDSGLYEGDLVVFKGKNPDGSYSFRETGGSGSMAKVYASEADVLKATGKKKVSMPVSEEAPKPPTQPEKPAAPPVSDLIEKNKEGLQKAGIRVSEKRRKGQRGSFSLKPTQNAPVWFSQLQRTIEQKMPNSASPEQIRGIIENPQNQVKADEIKWTGLDDYLKEKKGKVTKQEVTDFLKQNAITMEEVPKGEPTTEERFRHGVLETKVRQNRTTPAEDEEYHVLSEKMFYGGKPKYATYILPGARDYRELLFTLPRKPAAPAVYDTISTIRFRDGRESEVTGTPEYAQQYMQRFANLGPVLVDQRQELAPESLQPTDVTKFQSGHWDEPNVLAHVRFDDRTDAEGKKNLFVEEVQSDWHQQGKKQGYLEKPEEMRAKIKEARERGYKINLDYEDYVKANTPPQVQQYKDLKMQRSQLANRGWGPAARELSDDQLDQLMEQIDELDVKMSRLTRLGFKWPFTPNRDWLEKHPDAMKLIRTRMDAEDEASDLENKLERGVPEAPFSKTWHELVLKRMLRHAAENGYDQMSWTTGEQQAERYDLQKHVKVITLSVGDDGGFTVITTDKNNRTYAFYPKDDKELEGLVGREMADKLQEEAGKNPNLSGTLSGVDLKMGGSGMKGFYDKILPDFLKKYGKKWGAQVGETEIQTQKATKWINRIKQYRDHPGVFYVETVAPEDAEGEMFNPGDIVDSSAFDTKEEAEEELAERNRIHAGKKEKVHVIDITPAMKKSVLEEGQPISEVTPPSRRQDKSQFTGPPEVAA